MMVEKGEDLGLSLSLMSSSTTNTTTTTTTTENHHHHHNHRRLQLNLMPSSSSQSQSQSQSQSASPFLLQKASWNEAFVVSSDANSEMYRAGGGGGGGGGGETRAFLRGIDVNRMPPSSSTTVVVVVDCEEEGGVSSPNSTVSSISGKRSERDTNGEENDIERGDCSRGGISDEEDGDTSRKKLRLSKDQSAILEESFKEHNTLNPKQKLALAKQLNLRPRQVEVWFQNRRARTKLKQTEVDCEFLKRCCENLTDENRRLQKEVQELRALKMSPQFYMQMTPPTTLTMCPSCERVAVSSSSNAAAPVDANSNHNHNHHHHQHQRAALPINALPINAWGPPNPPIQQHSHRS